MYNGDCKEGLEVAEKYDFIFSIFFCGCNQSKFIHIDGAKLMLYFSYSNNFN